uniref:Uncharacterized protein LOC111119273 n=1 Tax=Crassostrea virginica TaxID=6565 RepID=A0A8B8CGQ3_CRAVI|nr:uncharacterized protein LOC111119273 [Crassostrea virginica]XP_022314993.1 uncharacterized protein LOC111119273 [Crassostrea virginica]
MQDINQDDVGDCVSCQQFTETCVNYRMTPCTTDLVYKCGSKFFPAGGPWWDSIKSCNGFRGVVPNRTTVWTRISRRSALVWTKSRCPAVDGIRVRCLSVTKINNTIYLNPQDCLSSLPSLCQGQPPNQGKHKPPVDGHDDSTVPLAVVFALACLSAFVLLGTTIFFRRQRNEERLHRLKEENYVSYNVVETEQEPHQYSSLQDITGLHRSLSSEGEGKGIHSS